MATPSPSFGRARRQPAAPAPPRRHVPLPADAPAQFYAADDPVAAELAAWKRGRSARPFPWRQVSLMAGLCFGIASLVLPSQVNDAAAYGLYGLSALGFISGLRRRRQRPS
jgi:hypothetical protein